MGFLKIDFAGKTKLVNASNVVNCLSGQQGITHLYLKDEATGNTKLQLTDTFDEVVKTLRESGVKVIDFKKSDGARLGLNTDYILSVEGCSKENHAAVQYPMNARTMTDIVKGSVESIAKALEILRAESIPANELHAK